MISFDEMITIGGVFIYTDEEEMNGGSFNVIVDTLSDGTTVSCTNTEGVGTTNSKGGVFNCGQEGRKLLIACSSETIGCGD